MTKNSQHNQAVLDEIIVGLNSNPPSISPKFFYDEIGSRLFEIITRLDEYYPTRTEAKIMQQYRQEIASAVGPCEVLLDLGAGNCQKASELFDALKPEAYRALDISKEFLESAVADLQKHFPHIEMSAHEFDLNHKLEFPDLANRRKTFFYPGSSIGNFKPAQALALFKNMVEVCAGGGGLLIGVDLIKDVKVLEKAYNDSLGVTAAFNLNALLHLNHLIQSNFVLDHWRHYAQFNEVDSRIEMYLESTQDQLIKWPGGERRFVSGELIHTENSYKYSQESFKKLLTEAGFKNIHLWTDDQQHFLVCYASAG